MYRTSKALALAATTLTLAAAPAIAATPLNDVRLDWTGNGEVQTRPPFGDSNYLSASVSDGTQSTYRAIDGPVQIAVGFDEIRLHGVGIVWIGHGLDFHPAAAQHHRTQFTWQRTNKY